MANSIVSGSVKISVAKLFTVSAIFWLTFLVSIESNATTCKILLQDNGLMRLSGFNDRLTKVLNLARSERVSGKLGELEDIREDLIYSSDHHPFFKHTSTFDLAGQFLFLREENGKTLQVEISKLNLKNEDLSDVSRGLVSKTANFLLLRTISILDSAVNNIIRSDISVNKIRFKFAVHNRALAQILRELGFEQENYLPWDGPLQNIYYYLAGDNMFSNRHRNPTLGRTLSFLGNRLERYWTLEVEVDRSGSINHGGARRL